MNLAVRRFGSICLLLLLASCNRQNAGGEQSAQAEGPPPAQVTAFAVEPRDAPITFEYTGQIAGSNEVEVHARVNGVIEKQYFEEGRAVEAGQPLIELDAAPFKAAVDQAVAALAVAKAQREQANAQLKKANLDYSRVAPLTQRQLLSQSQRDDAATQVDLTKAAVQQADAAIQQAEAGVSTARINLGYTRITAPISGIVGRALKRKGSLVQAGSDSLLTTIAQTNPAYVDFGIAEREQENLHQALADGHLQLPEQGFEVILKTTTGKQIPKTGRMNFQDYKVDQQTGNVAMRATIENSDRQLLPGQFVRVVLQGAKRPQALVVPQRAVLDNPQGKYVYVVGQNDKGMTIAQPQPVEVGEWVQLEGDLNNAWVIRSGLKPGQQVIVDGTARIFFPGMPVQLVSPAAANAAAPAAAPAAAEQPAKP